MQLNINTAWDLVVVQRTASAPAHDPELAVAVHVRDGAVLAERQTAKSKKEHLMGLSFIVSLNQSRRIEDFAKN